MKPPCPPPRRAAAPNAGTRPNRRTAACGVLAALGAGAPLLRAQPAAGADARFADAAARMRQLALSWSDQAYGAVLVLDGRIVGEGPSRVVQNNDPTAHAEREAIRDAQRRVQRKLLPGAVLYSTSRPCGACEEAAAEAQVSRMIHGGDLRDAGTPRKR
jgi:tRNA(adenine34) deaminase